jgi:hypothetical protein
MGETGTSTDLLPDLPPNQWWGSTGVARPGGTPPIFDTPPPIRSAPLALPLSARPPPRAPSTARAGEPGRRHPAPSEETPLANLIDVQHPPPKKRPKHKPPPKPNLEAGKGAVLFTLPPGPQPERSTARRTNIQRSADTFYILTPTQLALVAKSTASFSPTASNPGKKTPRPTPDTVWPLSCLGGAAAQTRPPLDTSNTWFPCGMELTSGDTQHGKP